MSKKNNNTLNVQMTPDQQQFLADLAQANNMTPDAALLSLLDGAKGLVEWTKGKRNENK